MEKNFEVFFCKTFRISSIQKKRFNTKQETNQISKDKNAMIETKQKKTKIPIKRN